MGSASKKPYDPGLCGHFPLQAGAHARYAARLGRSEDRRSGWRAAQGSENVHRRGGTEFRPRKARREIPDGGCRGLYLWCSRWTKVLGATLQAPWRTSASSPLAPAIYEKEARLNRSLACRSPWSAPGGWRCRCYAPEPWARTLSPTQVAKQRACRGGEQRPGNLPRRRAGLHPGHAMRRTHRWREQNRLLGLQPTAERLAVIPTGRLIAG